MGVLVPLLGLFVMLDLTSFWHGEWMARDWIKPEYGYLFVALVISGVYFVAASTVFPQGATTVAEFDAHYFENRRWILIAIFLCNLALFGWEYWLDRHRLSLIRWLFVPEYFVLVLVAAFARSRWLSIACLAGLILLFLFLALTSFLPPIHL